MQRDEDVIPHNIFPMSLYDERGREIPLLLFGERALIPQRIRRIVEAGNWRRVRVHLAFGEFVYEEYCMYIKQDGIVLELS